MLTIAPSSVKFARKYVRENHRHLKLIQGDTRGVAIAGNPCQEWQGTGRICITRVATDGARNTVGVAPRLLTTIEALRSWLEKYEGRREVMRFGICQSPFAPHGWLQPMPTIASYRALRALNMDGLRLQFDPTIASPAPGVWDTSLFWAWIEPAHAAGMRINANYNGGANLPAHHDAAFTESAAFRFAQEFGSMIESYSYGNEPGADAQAYEGDAGPTAERDYMRDVYFPTMCLPFVRGIRRALPDAWIGGCDADSANIQGRYTEVADRMLHPTFGNLPDGIEVPPLQQVNICDEEYAHPYGEVGGGDYATLEAFKAVRSHRPWGINEIDHQQLRSARDREMDALTRALKDGVQLPEASLRGALARLRPTHDETMALVDLLRKVGRNYSDCTRFMLNMPDYFFERGKAANGIDCCSFYAPEPSVSDGGRAFAAAFAEINGPVDPLVTTMPVRKRAAGK